VPAIESPRGAAGGGAAAVAAAIAAKAAAEKAAKAAAAAGEGVDLGVGVGLGGPSLDDSFSYLSTHTPSPKKTIKPPVLRVVVSAGGGAARPKSAVDWKKWEEMALRDAEKGVCVCECVCVCVCLSSSHPTVLIRALLSPLHLHTYTHTNTKHAYIPNEQPRMIYS